MEKTEKTEKPLAECEKLCQEYLDGWQRTKADFLNYKKDEAQRIDRIAESAQQDCLLKFLDVYENLERAEKNLAEQGISQIKEQFRKILDDYQVKEISALGEQFDPEIHEAVEQVENQDAKPGIIIEVLQKGYLVNGQILRPAKVKVNK